MKTKSNLFILCLFCFSSVIGQLHLDLQKQGMSILEIIEKVDSHYSKQSINKSNGFKPYLRWKKEVLRNINSKGEFIFPTPSFRTNLENNKRNRANNLWSEAGPSWGIFHENGNFKGTGRVNALAFHPSNPSIIYACSPQGGLWKSTTGGNTWSTTTDGLPLIGSSSVDINPNNPNHIVFSSGDAHTGGVPFLGIFTSLDAGETWYQMNDLPITGNYSRVFKIGFHPTNSNILFVASDQGFFRSEDGGQTWIKALDSQSFYSPEGYRVNNAFFDFEFHPTNPSIVYAIDKTHIYKSTNKGLDWVKKLDIPNSRYPVRTLIAISPDNPEALYALIGNEGGKLPDGEFGGLYLSENQGENFSLQSKSKNILGYDLEGASNQCWYDIGLTVSPTDYTKVITGGIFLCKSSNKGQTWTPINSLDSKHTNYLHADIHYLQYSNDELFIACDGGVFKTQDEEHYQYLSTGLQNTQIYRLSTTPADLDLVVAGFQDNGTAKKTEQYAQQWISIGGADGMGNAIDYTDKTIIYHSGQNGGIWKSITGKEDAIYIGPQTTSNGVTTKYDARWLTTFQLHPTNPNIIYSANHDLWKGEKQSNDFDYKWTILTESITTTSHTYLSSIATTKANPDLIFIGEEWTNTLHKTTNGGNSWTALKVFDGIIEQIVIHPYNENQIWAAVFQPGDLVIPKIYESKDGGITWSNISSNLPNEATYCIAYNPLGNELYVGTQSGVYVKPDGSQNWITFGDNLPNTKITDINIHEESGMIRVGTFGRGVWESPLYEHCNYSFSLPDTINGVMFLRTNEPLAINSHIKSNSTNKTTIYSSETILLRQGFEAKAGSEFKAAIAQCSQIHRQKEEKNTYVRKGEFLGKLPGNFLKTTSKLETSTVELYPNPTHQNLAINLTNLKKGKVSITLFDVRGKKLQQHQKTLNEGEYQINLMLGEYKPGVYFVKVNSNGSTQTKQVMKK